MTADSRWHFHYLANGLGFLHDERGRVRADRISEGDARDWLHLRAMAALDDARFDRLIAESQRRTPEFKPAQQSRRDYYEGLAQDRLDSERS